MLYGLEGHIKSTVSLWFSVGSALGVWQTGSVATVHSVTIETESWVYIGSHWDSLGDGLNQGYILSQICSQILWTDFFNAINEWKGFSLVAYSQLCPTPNPKIAH